MRRANPEAPQRRLEEYRRELRNIEYQTRVLREQHYHAIDHEELLPEIEPVIDDGQIDLILSPSSNRVSANDLLDSVFDEYEETREYILMDAETFGYIKQYKGEYSFFEEEFLKSNSNTTVEEFDEHVRLLDNADYFNKWCHDIGGPHKSQ